MKIALICSNLDAIDTSNKTGTGIFNHILIHGLNDNRPLKNSLTVFAAGSSVLPTKIVSLEKKSSSSDPKILAHGKHIMFELALIGRAFSMQSQFDLFHVNIGDGDLAMPFAQFVNKPILITLHHIYNENFTRKYFSLFKKNKNVYFISASNAQRKILPALQYLDTIYHGIDTRQFAFNAKGGKNIMWAGRYIPSKGPDIVLSLAQKLGRQAKLFGVIKPGFEDWLERNVVKKITTNKGKKIVYAYFDYARQRLIPHFQASKLFLLPILAEESFGLVFIEAMSCGTPVITFARGSAPEVIIDGVTGFLVNPSDDDIRGNWIIKKTGFAGLCEAVERIYALSPAEYATMRNTCRKHVVQNFSVEKMSKQYWEAYQKILNK